LTKSGIKTEDYREINTYWIKRLTKDFSWDMNKYPLQLNELKEVLNKGSINPKTFDFYNFEFRICLEFRN